MSGIDQDEKIVSLLMSWWFLEDISTSVDDDEPVTADMALDECLALLKVLDESGYEIRPKR